MIGLTTSTVSDRLVVSAPDWNQMYTFVNYVIVYYQDIYRTFHYSILLEYLQYVSLISLE